MHGRQTVLQEFKIMAMNRAKFNVILVDANYDADFERQFPMGPRQHRHDRSGLRGATRPQREVDRLAQELLKEQPAEQPGEHRAGAAPPDGGGGGALVCGVL
jgi:hypothetical protein